MVAKNVCASLILIVEALALRLHNLVVGEHCALVSGSTEEV